MMDASSFICALRHFLAIRDPVAKIRFDQGTNFVGDRQDADPKVHGRARLRMDVQYSRILTLSRCLGTPNQYSLTCIGHNAIEDRTFPANKV